MSQVDEYKRQLNKVIDGVDEKLSMYVPIQQAAKSLKVRPAYVAAAVVTLTLSFLLYGIGAKAVASIVGFVYPLYESFQSLKRKGQPGADAEESQWLTYWCVYSSFTLVESLTDALEQYIPLYHIIKILFLVWCMAPQTKGACLIYAKVIDPILLRYENKIDSSRSKLGRGVGEIENDFEAAGEDVIREKNYELINEAKNSLLGDHSKSS